MKIHPPSHGPGKGCVTWALTGAALALLLAAPTYSAPLQDESPDSESSLLPALTLGEGSVARQQIVAMGRDLVVRGEAYSDAAALNGSVEISGRVRGDVIVLAGDARLESTAHVQGDVFVLGGTIETSPGARIDGRSVSYPNAPTAWLILLEGPSLGTSPFSVVVLAAKLGLMAAWMLTAMLVLGTSRPQLMETAHSIRQEPFRNFVLGLTAVATLVLTLVFLSAFTTALVGVPLVVLTLLLALMSKLWGMVAVFYALGEFLCRRRARRVSPLTTTVVGLVLLGGVKLVPWLGIWVWSLATFIGVGAALGTKFGRREPWFEAPARRDYVFGDR